MRWLELGYERGRTIERVRAKLNERGEGCAWWRNRTEAKGEGMEWRTGANRVGWKTAKICITIADRNNYARNAREKVGGGIRTRMQMQTVRWWGDGGGGGGGDGGEGMGTETRLEMQIREYAGGSSRLLRKKKKKKKKGEKEKNEVG